VDLSLDKPSITSAKQLMRIMLSGSFRRLQDMLMDVNKCGEQRDGFARALFTAT
jgi:hypothetical protein